MRRHRVELMSKCAPENSPDTKLERETISASTSQLQQINSEISKIGESSEIGVVGRSRVCLSSIDILLVSQARFADIMGSRRGSLWAQQRSDYRHGWNCTKRREAHFVVVQALEISNPHLVYHSFRILSNKELLTSKLRWTLWVSPVPTVSDLT